MSRIRGKAIFMSQEAYDEVRRQANENGRTLGRQIDMIILGRIVKKEPEQEPKKEKESKKELELKIAQEEWDV